MDIASLRDEYNHVGVGPELHGLLGRLRREHGVARRLAVAPGAAEDDVVVGHFLAGVVGLEDRLQALLLVGLQAQAHLVDLAAGQPEAVDQAAGDDRQGLLVGQDDAAVAFGLDGEDPAAEGAARGVLQQRRVDPAADHLLVGQRRRLLNYLRSKDIERYRSLIERLGLRR